MTPRHSSYGAPSAASTGRAAVPPTAAGSEAVTPAQVATQPIPLAVDAVRRTLTAVLDSHPSLQDTLTVTEALDLLLDVDPPYPPLVPPEAPLEVAVGVPAALEQLDEAVAAATTVRDITRYTAVAMLLQHLPAADSP